MKRFTCNVLLALALAAPTPALAQSGAVGAEPPREPGGMNRSLNADGMMGSGTMPMMRMMMECASMMERMSESSAMSGGTSRPADPRSMMRDGMMGSMEGAKVDVATAEVIALAYLHGRNPKRASDAVILDAAVEDGRYIVTYRLGGTEGVVLVDAATGMVVSENQ